MDILKINLTRSTHFASGGKIPWMFVFVDGQIYFLKNEKDAPRNLLHRTVLNISVRLNLAYFMTQKHFDIFDADLRIRLQAEKIK